MGDSPWHILLIRERESLPGFLSFKKTEWKEGLSSLFTFQHDCHLQSNVRDVPSQRVVEGDFPPDNATTDRTVTQTSGYIYWADGRTSASPSTCTVQTIETIQIVSKVSRSLIRFYIKGCKDIKILQRCCCVFSAFFWTSAACRLLMKISQINYLISYFFWDLSGFCFFTLLVYFISQVCEHG